MADNTPLVDLNSLEKSYSNYTPPTNTDIPNLPFKTPSLSVPTNDGIPVSALTALENSVASKKNGKLTGGGISRTLAEVSSDRYSNFVPGDYDNEDAYAQGQGWTSKMVNGVGKGLSLTGTTLLQSTVGLVNSVARAIGDGRAASFYDNDFNRALDEWNKKLENDLPNYYTNVEKNANWYSPKKLLTANFFWDGIVKNLGFSAGAALSGGIYAGALKAIPLTARLFSIGKAAETLAATEEALLSAGKAAETYGKIKNLSDKFVQSYNILNPGGRALVAGLATTGEAGFEAYNNLNQFRDERIQEYKNSHNGQEPIGADLDAINSEADHVGNSSFLLNTGLLSATNYIQFPKILGSSYTAEKGLVNGLAKETRDIVKNEAGQFVEQLPTTRFGKLLHTVNKIRPYTFSTSEGFEEGAQYAIQVGTQDYYNKKYKGQAADFVGSLAEGITQTLGTNEGMENVLIGGLSGSLMMAKGNFQQAREKGLNTAQAIQSFNKWKLSDFTKDTIDSVNRGTAIQEDREKAIKAGDVLEAKDLSADYIINYLTPRIKYGRMDLVKSDIADMKTLAMSDEGFAQLQSEGKALATDTKDKFLQRLANLESTAENVKSLYQSLNLRYGGLVDKNGKAVYSPEVMDKMVYAASKVADYDKRIPTISNNLLLKGIDPTLVINDLAKGNNASYEKALADINELSVNADVKEDLIRDLQDVSELSLRRQKFLKEYDEIKKNPNGAKEVEEVPAPVAPGEKPATIKIKTKTGEGDYEIGTEYFLGKVVDHDAKGNEIVRFPRLTILGENEDGTIKIKTSNGNTRDISKAELADYKLSKVSDTLANKKAKFFMDNVNNVFEFNFGKGKKQKGRLEYSPKEKVLNFVYKGKDGKIKRIEVTGDQFVAKEGFKNALITKIGEVTPAEQKSMEDFAKEKDERQAEKRAYRLQVLNDLFNDLSEKHTAAKKLIAQKESQVKTINEELAELEEKIKGSDLTKKNRFKASTKRALNAAMKLSRMKDQLTNEIESLRSESDELELNASYVADLADNIDQLPTDSKEFLAELKDQKAIMEDLILETGKQINSISSLIDKVGRVLESAIDLVRYNVAQFKAKFPKAPLALGAEFNDFLEANPNFLKNKPEYISDLNTLEDFVSQVEDLDITPNERTLGELKDELKELQAQLADLEKEYKAKDAILSRFQEVAEQYKVQKQQEEKLAKDEGLRKSLLGTNSNDVENNVDQKDYQPEAKKSDLNVVGSTVPVNDAIPYQERVNKFGVKFHSMPNRDKLKGVHVTLKTEDAILPGLIGHLTKDAPGVDKNDVIAFVIVQENGDGSINLVDENGEVITEGKDLLNTAIYQVKPASKLEMTYNGKKETMFRSSTPLNVQEELSKQYVAERAAILAQTSLAPALDIDASFGQLEYVKTTDQKGNVKVDYEARTSSEDAGLIKSTDLAEKRLIRVATTNTAESNGSVTFNTPLGRVFLEIPGGLVKLINSKFNKKKAETIFKAIHALAKEAVSAENGIKSEKSTQLLSWLKSVVYWGIPKNKAGYNSIWFQEVADTETKALMPKLFISGEGASFDFTPSGLEQNKDVIIALLEGLYHNTNATMVNVDSYNKPYYEITDIAPDGTIKTQEWPNYQTYLLSGKGRDAKDIPLSTRVAPAQEGKPNRKGIYFTISNTADNYVIPKEAPKSKTPKKEEKKQEPKKEEPKAPSPQFVYDGETKNVFDSAIGRIVFAADKTGKIFFFEDAEGKLDEETAATVKKLAESKGISEDKAKDVIYASLKKHIGPDIAAIKIPKQAPLTPAKISTKAEKGPSEATAPGKVRNPFGQSKAVAPDDEVYRLKLVEEIKKFEGENWKAVEAFLKKNFPNIPVYRVKNIIQASNGRQAWGMLQNGAIYLYTNAEVGTAYHEVFEAVWKMFAKPAEQQSVLKEFRGRKGSFTDRPTGKTVEYSKATDEQIKEELAEEFRDYILYNKIPAKPTDGRPFIVKLFADLVQFLKEFFVGENATFNTEKLFKQIGNGYYKDYVPYEAPLAFAKQGLIDIDDVQTGPDAEYRIVNIPATQIHEIMQQMTYSTLKSLTKKDESLFTIPKVNKTILYTQLKKEILDLIEHRASLIAQALDNKEITNEEAADKFNNLKYLHDNVNAEWDNLTKKHEEEYLKQYSIEFDDNDNTTITDENNSGKEDYIDARKVDNFRKANSAIKLLLATLPETQVGENGKLSLKRSSIHGAMLMPLDRVFITLMNNLHESTTLEDMLNKLREFARQNRNYEALYTRLTKNDVNSDSVDFSKITNEHNIQLLASFWKTFKKQNPDVKTVFILPTGEVIIGESNLSSAAKQAKNDMYNSVLSSAKDNKNPYIKFDKKDKVYNATPLAKSYKLLPSTLDTYIAFLKGMGVPFTVKELKRLKPNQLNQFKKATEGLLLSLSKIEGLVDINKKTLDVEGRLLELGTIRAILENPDFESTFFNINGERTQTYIGTNSVSNLYDVISKLKNISELANTPYKYLLTDAFTKGSTVINAMFNPETGNRRETGEEFLKTGYVNGLVNEAKGREKDPARYNLKDRFIQELNMNNDGWYLNLIPGDASIEHTNYVGNHISKEGYTNNAHHKIFKDYFISELNVAREGRKIVYVGDRKSDDLRFFKDILGASLHKDIVKEEGSPEEVYAKYESKINSALDKFIKDKAAALRQTLQKYGIVSYEQEGLTVDGLSFVEENPTEEALNKALELSTANYMVANIEFHKLIYSDPYFYKDELKRIKNFNSPGQALLANSPEINDRLNSIYNKGYEKGDIGFTDMTRDHFRSSVISDVFSSKDLEGYDPFEETDGGGYISMKANRVFRLRAGDWTEDNERQYRYDVAFEKEKKKIDLSKEEEELLKKGNPSVKSTYTPIKPIVRGSKDDGESFNDVVLDKFALVPLSYRILFELNPSSNAIKHYNKMQREDVDYTVFASGRKVGAGITTPLYNEDGSYNTLPFNEVNNIPFEIVAVQTEVPSKESNTVTQGSQVTKLVTLDYMENGVPVDYKGSNWEAETDKEAASPIYKEIKNNQTLLEESIKEGYNILLNKLGIKAVGKGFEIGDVDKLVDTLKSEIFKREVNDNIVDAFNGYKKGDVILEATPAYQKIRNILYSIADKSVVRRKINGGQKVQIPSTLLESVKAEATKVKGKNVYSSDTLNFYVDKDGQRVCEVMVGRWFDSDKSDAELIKELNETGALNGVGFRIPTQKQNSIDVFKIKQLLPREFGDSVVIPSALVKKVGSDFDIDKLSVYLKNVYKDLKGNTKVVPFLGYGEQAKKQFASMYEEGAFLTDEQRKKAQKWIKNRKIEDKDEATESLFKAIFGEQGFEASYEQEVIDDLLDSETDAQFKEKVVNQKYKESLENAYIQSLENLISHPLNFERLTTPNSADQLKALSKEIVKKTNSEEYDYSSVGNMLDRQFMSSLRQDFLTGKYAIGIAATSQTNHSQNQRTNIYIDTDKLADLPDTDKRWLGDGQIKFKKFNTVDVNGKKRPSLSGIKNAAGDYISDIIGQFIDGYVDISKGPWIMQMGASPNVAGLWLFLTKIGVPIKTVGYFMNQPIVKDYLRSVENAGYTYLFMEDFVNKTKDEYATTEKAIVSFPTEAELERTLGKDVEKMSGAQKLQQQLILDEFMKYAKMAEQLFLVQQASNFDTATLNDPYLIFKKLKQLERSKTSIISSVDKLISNSFIGALKNTIQDVRNAFSTILISDKSEKPTPGSQSVREVLETVLSPYIDLNDRDFVKISQKAVADMFDWAVQTNQQLNAKVKDILLGSDTEESAAEEIMKFVNKVKADESHPLHDNYIINSIRRETGSAKENTPNNLSLVAKSSKVYDQNQVIYGFNELKKGMKDENSNLYDKLVYLAVLQSGLVNSKISFTQLLPYEDFKNIYNETLSILNKMPNLADFKKLNVFERNNWNNSDIVPFLKSRPFKSKKGKWIFNREVEFADRKLKSAFEKGILPRTISVSANSREGKNDFMVYSWEPYITKEKKKQLRAKGDYSYIKKGLFQKVYNSVTGEPEKTTYKSPEGRVYESYVYKAVNAWGDSFRANEFYNSPQQSVINNGFESVKQEVIDDEIISILNKKPVKSVIKVKKEKPSNSDVPNCA